MACVRPFDEIIEAIVAVVKHYDALPAETMHGVPTAPVRDALVSALSSAAFGVAQYVDDPKCAWELVARMQGNAQDAHCDRVMGRDEGHEDDPQWHVSSALYWVLHAEDDWLERKRHWLA